jgi:hypothetical protein
MCLIIIVSLMKLSSFKGGKFTYPISIALVFSQRNFKRFRGELVSKDHTTRDTSTATQVEDLQENLFILSKTTEGTASTLCSAARLHYKMRKGCKQDPILRARSLSDGNTALFINSFEAF